MSALVFPYSLHKGRSLPIIPIGIRSRNGQWWKINAYLDSGAFYSIFDDTVAELLELPLAKGGLRHAIVGDGDTIPFYVHQIELQVGKDQFPMAIGFSKQLKVGFNILGLDLFDRYQTTFNNRKKVILMQKI